MFTFVALSMVRVLTLLLIDHLKPFQIATFKNAHWFCTHMVIPSEQCW